MLRAEVLEKLKEVVRESPDIAKVGQEFLVWLFEKEEEKKNSIVTVMRRDELSREFADAVHGMRSSHNPKNGEFCDLLNKLRIDIYFSCGESEVKVWINRIPEALDGPDAHAVMV